MHRNVLNILIHYNEQLKFPGAVLEELPEGSSYLPAKIFEPSGCFWTPLEGVSEGFRGSQAHPRGFFWSPKHACSTADFIKKVLSVYSHSMTTIYLSLSAQVAKSTFFMKSLVPYYNMHIMYFSFFPSSGPDGSSTLCTAQRVPLDPGTLSDLPLKGTVHDRF